MPCGSPRVLVVVLAPSNRWAAARLVVGPARQLVPDLRSRLVTVNGHRLFGVGGFVYCGRCGAHTQRFLRGLTAACPPAVPLSGGRRAQLDNLRAGRHPRARVSDGTIGAPVRLTLRAFLAWRAGTGVEEVSLASAQQALAEGGLRLQ